MGKKPDLASLIGSLFKVDTSDRARRGIQISLLDADDSDQANALTPRRPDTLTQLAPTPRRPDALTQHAPTPLGYGVHIENGRIIREARHSNSEHAHWAPVTGPALTEIERLSAASRPPEPPVPLDTLEYVIVDLETTGGALGRGHRITEIAIVRVDARARVLHEFTTLVNPGRRIPPDITALTNITTDMVRQAPHFEDIAHDVRTLLQGRIFVAHNATFDWGFLDAELLRAVGKPLQGRRLCTVRLARKLVPEVRSRSLDSLSYFFNVVNEARHRAFGDARATARIFRKLLERVQEREITSWQELEHLTLRRSQRRKRRATPVGMEDA